MKSKIKAWYTSQFPTDELGEELNPDADFQGLLDTLNEGGDIYYYIFAYDSLIRERLFEKLAELKNVPYNDIYYLWLGKI